MNYKTLLNKLERTLERIETSERISSMLHAILESIVKEYGKELGIIGGRIYEKANSHYQLLAQTGVSNAPANYQLSMLHSDVQQVRREGQIFMRGDNCSFEVGIDDPIKIPCFAAISLGDNDEYLISFTLQEPIDEPHVHYCLTMIRHVANLKIRHRRLEGYISEARKIQMSLLPQTFPQFFDYDIFGQSIPAEIVGGDLLDVIPVSETILGLAIADASGHGLPAALQVRDVFVALRMGLEKDMKIVRTVEKLNRVLSQSASMGHEFITLFYAELEDNGNFFYCNAGHHPPLFFAEDGVHELRRGGLILGPYPKAKYERGFEFFEPGNILVMYSDGVTEALSPAGEEFGTERISRIVHQNRDATSKELSALIFQAVEKFTDFAVPTDDRTVYIVKKG